jgi:hypothetical protein
MAKDKKKKTDKSKDAGAKLAKEIGKQADKFVELAKHPFVADIVSAGLAALAANVTKNLAKAKDEKPVEKKDAVGESAMMLATALAAKAAEKVSSKLFETPAPSPAPAPRPAPAAKPAARKPAAPNTDSKPVAKAASKPATAKATTAKKPTAGKPAAAKPATMRKPRTPRTPAT